MMPGRVGAVARATGPAFAFAFALRTGWDLAASRDLAAALSLRGWRALGFGLAQPAL